MSRQNIKVSVIMACYNSSRYLDQSVSSVLGQTFSNLELILIDDCSTDNTFEIAKRYQIRDDRVSALSLPVHSGPAAARNAGIRAARGEWIGILDSDDVALPSRFEDQMRLADTDKDLVMIGSNSISIDDKGHPIKEHIYPTDNQKLVRRLYSQRAFPAHSSQIYRKDAVERLSGYNPRYLRAQDYDLLLRVSRMGEFTSIGKVLVKIRKHECNISNSDGGTLQAKFGCAAVICHFLRAHGCPDPSNGSDEAAWQEFLSWVKRRMMEESVFESRKAWSVARSEFFGNKTRLISTLRFGTRLLLSGHAGGLVWKKYFGSKLPQRLAREWMNQ